MTSKAQERRRDLHARLIDIAQSHIATHGLGAIKARDLAKQAECSVGAIYNVFADLKDIVIAVNGRTFQALGAHVAAALTGKQDEAPTQQLIIMSLAYMEYAAEHPRLWRALFELRMSAESEVPEWYLAEMGRLFGFINGPVAACFPDYDEHQIDLMTRALFSSVHGIVLLGIENRISGVPREHLEHMLAMVLTAATSKS